MPCHLPRWIKTGARVGCFPVSRGLPRYAGGSASTSSLSGPAQASRSLRPAELLNHPKWPSSRGSSLAGYPAKPPASYQIKPTTICVVSSSTGDLRRRGARRVEKRRGGSPWGLLRFPFPLIKPDVPISGIRLSDWLHVRHTAAAQYARVADAARQALRRSHRPRTCSCQPLSYCAV